MLGIKKMTPSEKRLRCNYLRREKLKIIKEENGEDYKRYLEQQKKSRERLKSDEEHYQNRLEKQRKYGKNFREKIKSDPAKYLQFNAQRAAQQRKRMSIYRANLHDAYLNKLLIQQGFGKTKITKELTQLKKLNLQTIRLVRNNESQKVLGRYINKNFNLKKGGRNREKITIPMVHTPR